MKRQKGALTVEATIATPIFILVLLFIINFLNIFYLQLVIQQGLNHVANTVGEYCYAVDLTVGMDKFSLSENTKEKETKLKGAVEGAFHAATETLELLNGKITLEKLPKLVESGKTFYGSVKEARETVGTITGDDVYSYLFSTALDAGGGSIVGAMMEEYLEAMNVNSRLLDGPINYHVYVDAANQYDLVFVAVYRYKQPLSIEFMDSIPMRQVVRVHPWIGGKTEGIRGLSK